MSRAAQARTTTTATKPATAPARTETAPTSPTTAAPARRCLK